MYPLLDFWTIDGISLVLLLGLVLLYGYVADWQRRPGVGWYAGGVVLVALVQTSPLHVLGAYYLLSAHMTGHILLLLLAAPLLVLGLPKQPINGKKDFVDTLSSFWGKRPWLGWVLGVGVMWFWHVPTVYDATVAPDYGPALGDVPAIPLCRGVQTSADWLTALAHVLHPLSLLLAGMSFAWPVLGPRPQYRIHPLRGVVYLATACASCSLLGLLIAFAPVGVYQTYTGADYYGLLGLVRQTWGLDPSADQQMAGLLMWVPGCLIYLTGVLYLFTTWLTANEITPQPVLT